MEPNSNCETKVTGRLGAPCTIRLTAWVWESDGALSAGSSATQLGGQLRFEGWEIGTGVVGPAIPGGERVVVRVFLTVDALLVTTVDVAFESDTDSVDSDHPGDRRYQAVRARGHRTWEEAVDWLHLHSPSAAAVHIAVGAAEHSRTALSSQTPLLVG